MPNDCCEALSEERECEGGALVRLLLTLELEVCGGIGELPPTPVPPPSCPPHWFRQGGDSSGVSRSSTTEASVPFSAAALRTTLSMCGHFQAEWLYC